MTVICALVFSQTRRDEVLTNALLCTNGVVPGWSATLTLGLLQVCPLSGKHVETQASFCIRARRRDAGKTGRG
jgi:hypothetical protein